MIFFDGCKNGYLLCKRVAVACAQFFLTAVLTIKILRKFRNVSSSHIEDTCILTRCTRCLSPTR